MTYKLADLRGDKKPAQLWGHERGREARASIESWLDAAPQGSAVYVSLENVEIMDVSYSIEAFGKLYASMASLYPGKALVLEKLNDYVRENLDATLGSRSLMALIIDGPRTWSLIGKASDTDRQTLDALRRRKQATTAELAKDLNLNLTAVNQRLRKLADSGLVVRTKTSAASGGDQFVYKWPA